VFSENWTPTLQRDESRRREGAVTSVHMLHRMETRPLAGSINLCIPQTASRSCGAGSGVP
jgi:hypothetical protein